MAGGTIRLKKCCFCFSNRTGALIIGIVGIIASVSVMVPQCILLDNHDYYIQEYIKQQRMLGIREIPDDCIPTIENFSKTAWTFLIAYDVSYTFFCILLIAGVTTSKRILLIPWLCFVLISILCNIVLIWALMFAFENMVSLFLFLITAPFFGLAHSFWLNVYTVYRELAPKKNNTTNTTTTTNGERPSTSVTSSASTSSFASVKGSLQRVIGGTPPPPYEAVAIDIDKEEIAIANGVDSRELTFSSVVESPEDENKIETTPTTPGSSDPSTSTSTATSPTHPQNIIV